MSANSNSNILTCEMASLKDSEAIQISSIDEKDRNILSVIVKKTYTLSPKGLCEKSDNKIPLNFMFEYDKRNPQILIADTDIYCNKPFTDVVIKGNVYSNGVVTRSLAKIQVNDERNQLTLNISGKRIAYKNQYDKVLFTDAEPLETIPLEYNYAYGGVDHIAEEKFQLPEKEIMEQLPEFDWMETSPYRYPRNPVGKGYLIEDNLRSIESFELPNIEDPMQPLTPLNLLVKKPENWVYQPLSRCTTWVDHSWFPRIAYFGLLPEFDKAIRINNLPEFMQKLVDPEILEDKPMMDKLNVRASNGASLGLQFKYLNGNEVIRLVNIHPKQKDFVLQLPADYPTIWIDGRKGKLLPTKPVIHTIVIEPDENRLSIVWRGSGPALRPYHEEELKSMPFKVEWRKY